MASDSGMKKTKSCLSAFWIMQVLILLLVAPATCAAANDTAKINPDKRLGQIHLIKKNGRFEVRLDENGRALSQREFLQLLYEQQHKRDTNFLFRIFNITSWFNLVWVILGFAGQICFSGRMLVQWIASERRGRSVVPVVFWWMSICGACMLLVYFIWRKDIVGVLGQSTGLIIYLRNLKLIYGQHTVAG
jgi:lipid-A-disaccharide synthase-like uncharacterized protein